MRMFATNSDSGESYVWSDSATGSFSIPLSDKIFEYNLYAEHIPGPYIYPTMTVHPGKSLVLYNITLVGVDDGTTGTPVEYHLGQNYPNPFNPATTISYAIPSRSLVSVIVYDILGRKVETLVNEVQEPGVKSVTYDAGGLSSGVYYYRLKAGNFEQTRKMLLVK